MTLFPFSISRFVPCCVPVLKIGIQQSEVLTAIYGEFFLAELIEAQNEHNHALVAEVGQIRLPGLNTHIVG